MKFMLYGFLVIIVQRLQFQRLRFHRSVEPVSNSQDIVEKEDARKKGE
ncbi:unnamed protein product [Camellia sinensis]